jgi:serine/threonine protein kinase/ABC-type branched-subunit amino acid transport system substrate-binding protein
MMKCPFCGSDNQPGENFCTNCGGYLGSTTAAPAANVPVTGSGTTGSTAVSATTTGGGSGGTRTLVPGSTLQNGRYVVDKVLGEGGMGAAVLARDTRVSNKRVVIKELVSDTTDPKQHQEDVRNFEREVDTLAQLDHPLIPTVTDSFQEGSHYFMVQEYAAGETLEARMERTHQPMDEKEALTYASQVLDILDYLEEQNPPIVHRDIKPANIIVSDRDKRARLVDFGIARAQANKSAKRKQTSALGTPGYAPPEQYQGNADQRSDLYALAATLHHILTNRDPRDYPPFVYPPVRSLNPKLSPDIERVLDRALKINANERYQNAEAMKQDIDAILASRFSSSGDKSSYTLHPSSLAGIAPSAPPPPLSYQPFGGSGHAPRQRQQQQQMMPPSQYQPGQFQSGPVLRPKTRLRISPMMRNMILLVVVILLIALVLFALPHLLQSGGGAYPVGGGNTSASAGSLADKAIGAAQIGNVLVGVSDGSYAFDTNRADGSLKQQAAAKLRSGDTGSAAALLSQAVSMDSNDAEALIYQQDLRVANFPHITAVVGTMPSGDSSIVGVGRDDLQGAYVAQQEFNSSNANVKLRLLIASTGDSTSNVTTVAQQIVRLAQTDKTFVGVIGWPYSGLAYAAITVFTQAHIPMISGTASGDQLSGISPYFFHVAPTNKAQASAGAQYAVNTLRAKKVVVFADNSDIYSQSLASDFTSQFQAAGGSASTVNYTVGNASSVQAAVQQALQKNPDLIYFAGYSSDVSTLLTTLGQDNAPANLNVLGGDALYSLGGYQPSSRANFSRLHFTAFAYPDEWDIQGLTARKPAFFSDYGNDFDPNQKHPGYGFTRPDNDVMLSYDATEALIKASVSALGNGTTTTPVVVDTALSKTAFQGVSGWITFDQNGDPMDKAVVILKVDPQGHIQMEQVVNKFLNS